MADLPRNLLAEWSALLVDGFVAAGVRDVVISPGSRSTPFVLAFAGAAERGLVRCHDVIDERAAAFFALGLAKASGLPSLLLCTSGTAGAHYLPAVIEAGLSFMPLVVVTADRPFELQACAAPQTIDQVKLFGDHARSYVELGLADPSESALRAVRRLAVQAVATASGPLPGAVHINARARKPLEPPTGSDETKEEEALRSRARRIAAEPAPRWFAPRLVPDERGVDELVEACLRARRGVIVAGPAALSQAAARPELFALAAATGFPLFAEAPSQLRFVDAAVRGNVFVADAFDAVLGARAFRDGLAPDLILQLGAPPTSSAFEAWLDGAPDCARWVLAAHGWPDPSSRARAHLAGEVRATATAVTAGLLARRPSGPEPTPWAARLASANAAAWRVIDVLLDEARASGVLLEAEAVRRVIASLPRGATLAVGNSLPIRELDTFCRAEQADCLVWSQRGANGIDGLIAGAAGVAQSGRPTTLLVGDIAFLHDLGGLGTARGLDQPLVIVVLQNHGGRIFEQLPLGAMPSLARHLPRFTTPHDLSLEPAARLFGHRYHAATTRAQLDAALAAAHGFPGCTVIEVTVPPHGAAETARLLRARLDAALAALTDAATLDGSDA